MLVKKSHKAALKSLPLQSCGAKANPQLHAGAGLGHHLGARMVLCSTGEPNKVKNLILRAAAILTFSLSSPPLSVSDDIKESLFAMAKEVRKTLLGPLSPKCSLLANIKTILQRTLPEDSYQLASGRLHISLTRVVDGQNVIASEFSSKEELIQVKGPSADAVGRSLPTAWDGGTEEAVITVSPFTGELDICPRDCPAIFFCYQIFNGSIQISIENLCRISYALFPPSTMVSTPGYQDTALFLYRNS
uniref:Uncharacterized protein n=1 Tax=Strix occidentalis caurina TaxID=311401 RepID=A0A8D0FA77_STROC